MDLSEAKLAGYEKLGETLCKKLNSLGYSARYVKDKDEGLRAALELIPEGASVGVPGTVTVREIGLIEELKKRGSKVSVHWDPDLKPEGKAAEWLAWLENRVKTYDPVQVYINRHILQNPPEEDEDD